MERTGRRRRRGTGGDDTKGADADALRVAGGRQRKSCERDSICDLLDARPPRFFFFPSPFLPHPSPEIWPPGKNASLVRFRVAKTRTREGKVKKDVDILSFRNAALLPPTPISPREFINLVSFPAEETGSWGQRRGGEREEVIFVYFRPAHFPLFPT